MEDTTEEWSADERRRLDALASEEAPPADLEGRVVAALKGSGTIASPDGSRRKTFFASRALAVAAAIVIAFASGRASRRETPSRTPGPRFALFLYEGPRFVAGPEGDRVLEYRAWARRLRAAGVEINGERLEDGGISVTPGGETEEVPASTSAGERLAGYFIVAAPRRESAVAIAKSCPHARHGGTVVVRPIAES